MFIGMLLIAAGILIAVYPPLLAIIVASVLIIIGVILITLSYRFKKMRRNTPDPYTNFFMRF